MADYRRTGTLARPSRRHLVRTSPAGQPTSKREHAWHRTCGSECWRWPCDHGTESSYIVGWPDPRSESDTNTEPSKQYTPGTMNNPVLQQGEQRKIEFSIDLSRWFIDYKTLTGQHRNSGEIYIHVEYSDIAQSGNARGASTQQEIRRMTSGQSLRLHTSCPLARPNQRRSYGSNRLGTSQRWRIRLGRYSSARPERKPAGNWFSWPTAHLRTRRDGRGARRCAAMVSHAAFA